jgi:hypothetical protein
MYWLALHPGIRLPAVGSIELIPLEASQNADGWQGQNAYHSGAS